MGEDDMDFKQLMNVFEEPIPNVNLIEPDAVFDNGFSNNLKRRRSRFSGCFATMEKDVKNAKDQQQLTMRLRRASEVHSSGLISKDEKDALKDMLLSRDNKFAKEFDQAQQTGNWDNIREKIHRPRTNSLTPRRSSLLMAMMDQNEDGFLGDDLSAVFDSTGLDLSEGDLKNGFMLRQGTDLSVAKRNSLLSTAKNMLNDKSIPGGMNQNKSAMEIAMAKRNSLLIPPTQKKVRNMASIPENNKIKTENTETKEEVGIKPRGRGRPKGSGKGRGTNRPRGSGKKSTSSRGRGGRGGASSPYGAGNRMSANMPGMPTDAFYPPPPGGVMNADDLDQHAKFRKNERERRRRLVVSQGFNDLVSVLNLGDSAKVDKATVLNTAIRRIKMLEKKVQTLEAENLKLKSMKKP